MAVNSDTVTAFYAIIVVYRFFMALFNSQTRRHRPMIIQNNDVSFATVRVCVVVLGVCI